MTKSVVSAVATKTTTVVAGKRGIVKLNGSAPSDNAVFMNNVLATMAVCGMLPTKKKVPA